jgi:DUF3068 family protein
VSLRSVRHVRTDSDASTGKVIVFEQGLCILRDDPGATTCSHSASTLLSVVFERIASDRKSGASVPGYGSALDGTPVVHKGLTLKFPFNVKKGKTYPFWDYNIKGDSPAVYAGTDKIGGLQVYRYTVHTPKTKAELLPGVAGFYADDRTLWVEPETGVIIKASDKQVKTFTNGSPAAQLTINTAPESITTQLNKAKDGRNQIHALSGWLPLTLLIVGIAAAVGAFLLLRRDDDAEPGPGPAHRSENPPVPVGAG